MIRKYDEVALQKSFVVSLMITLAWIGSRVFTVEILEKKKIDWLRKIVNYAALLKLIFQSAYIILFIIPTPSPHANNTSEHWNQNISQGLVSVIEEALNYWI